MSKNKSSTSELGENLNHSLDQGKSQTTKMLNLLTSVIDRDGNEAKSLMELYDLYCLGYSFLEDLGLGIGLCISVPTTYGVLYFHKLNQEQKNELLNIAYPKAKELAEELRNWLINRELILTGERKPADWNRWQFIDNRKERDKESRLWKACGRDEKTNEVNQWRNIMLDKNGNFIGESKTTKK